MKNLILLGRITGAHGIRGAVKLTSFTADPASIAAYGPLQTADGSTIEILRLKPAKDEFIADLKDVKDRNTAEALKGTELFVARSRLPALKEREFYLFDLVGKSVMSEEKTLGTVASLADFGAGDLMELDNGEFVPVAFIVSAGEVIIVDLPPAYLDPPSQEDKNH